MRHCHDPADIRISQPKNRNPGFGPTQNGGCAVPCPHQLTIHQRAREGAIKNAAPLPLVSGPLWHVMFSTEHHDIMTQPGRAAHGYDWFGLNLIPVF